MLLSGAPRSRLVGTGPLGVQHVNSGFSYVEHGRGHIVVFRCAEAHRTLVHELLHAWRVHGEDQSRAQRLASRVLGAPSSALLSEAFVEAMAWLLMRGLSPSTTHAEELEHSFTLMHRYTVCECDDGTTNAWSYIVGRTLLIADGGGRLCAFLKGDPVLGHGSMSRVVDGVSAYHELVGIMYANRGHVPKHKGFWRQTDGMPTIRMVKGDWGGAFDKTFDRS